MIITRGTIIHSYGFDDIDHGKFFVVVGVSHGEVAGFFFINSNINRFLHDKPEMMNMQFCMRKEDYSFLRYDSFLAGHEILKIRLDVLESDITQGNAKKVGQMKDEHLQDILIRARQSKLFRPRDKKNFLY